jgi:ribosomal protein S24E
MEKLTLISKKENPMFNRQEAELSIEINVTPKISEAEEMVAKEFSTNAENVKIRKIKGRFGSRKFIITANIYNSKEEKDQIESKNKKEKKKEVKK